MEKQIKNYNVGEIRTFTGKYFNVDKVSENLIDIKDIAHALSMICRFGGHIRRFYSVAQHSCHAYELSSKENKLPALLHDASEAYILDMPKPIKVILSQYQSLEENLNKCIFNKFKIKYPIDEEIKLLDRDLFEIERDDLVENKYVALPTMSQKESEEKFLEYFYNEQ